MIKKIFTSLALALSVVLSAQGQTAFPLFQPSNGIMVGSDSTYVTSSATSSNVISLWSGTCNATSFLRGDGSCAFAASTPANPTASLGLTAINGVATTYMRSDAAPALSQSIIPTWTGQHTFTSSTGSGATLISSNQPYYGWNETDAAADNRRWRLGPDGETWRLQIVDDAISSGVTAIAVDRTNQTVDSIAFTATALTWGGSSLVNLASSPTWTGRHIWTQATSGSSGPEFNSQIPGTWHVESDATANNTTWRWAANAEIMRLSLLPDDRSVSADVFTVSRSAQTATAIGFTSTALSWNGSSMVNVASSPTWTGTHTFTGTSVGLSNTNPILLINNTSAGVDSKRWDTSVNSSGTWQLFTRTDGGAIGSTALAVSRSGTTVSAFDINPPIRANAVGTSASPTMQLGSTRPVFALFESDAAANNGLWVNDLNSEQFRMMVSNDAGSSSTTWLAVDRTANTVDSIALTGTTVTVNGQNVCRQDGTGCNTTGAANPTASVGLTAVNGSATTYMRSDGAPALSQAIAPTWSAQHTFSLAGTTSTPTVILNSTRPVQAWYESDAAADSKRWILDAEGGSLRGLTVTDAGALGATWLEAARTGTTVDLVALGATRVTASNVLNVGNINTTNASILAAFGALGSNRAAWLSTSAVTPIAVAAFHNTVTAGDSTFADFRTENTTAGTVRGSISYNRAGGVVAYNTTSDRRLKKNIVDAPSAGNSVDKIRVRSFDWKENGHDHVPYGFVAQELYEVAPQAVTKGDSKGGETPEIAWQVDNAKLVPMLVKEIQDLRKRVAELEARH